jgi:hypothetical protein
MFTGMSSTKFIYGLFYDAVGLSGYDTASGHGMISQ